MVSRVKGQRSPRGLMSCSGCRFAPSLKKTLQANLVNHGSMPKRRRREGAWQRKNKQKVGNDVESTKTETRGAGYKPIVMENSRFVKYYQGQGVIPEEEWEDFMSILRQPLPLTFRITGTQHVAKAVRECLQQTVFVELVKAVQESAGQEGEKLAPPTSLPWYPDQLAWHVPLSRAFIRKSPEVSKFHRFLVDESEQGNISRQEAVSMIPPLLLDVQPHHKVLDMCAAPGSKTAQLIEMIHVDDKPSSSSLPSGVVVANDADNKRCYMLVHQAKRLKSPCFMVTNHDASVFPMLYYNNEEGARCPLYYDRILCDVPCSGDGTMRKNPTIWRSWSPSLGAGLHRLQLRILNRGLELLRTGGRLVYSTCSLNPLENEAVISTMLQLCKGAVELVDVSDKLPGLRTIPGLTSWKVMNKKMEWMTEAQTSSSSTFFPPDPSLLPYLKLQRCVRVLPHHQDTGGFFIAVLQKLQWLPWQRKPPISLTSIATSSTTSSLTYSSTSTSTSISFSCSSTASPIASTSCTTPALTINEQKEGIGAKEIAGERPEVLAVHQTVEEGGGGGGSESGCVQQEGESGTGAGEKTSDGCIESRTTAEEEEEMEARASLEKKETDKVGNEAEDSIEHQKGLGGEGEEEKEPTTTAVCPGHIILGKPGHRQTKKGRIYKEDPYVFLTESNEILEMIRTYYGLGEEFPSGQLLTRSVGGKKRNIYLTSHLVKELLQRNELHVKFINVGVKVLARCDNNASSCPFRLCQEGIDSLVPFITKNRVSLTLEDLILVLKEPNPLSTGLASETQTALALLSHKVGPALFGYKPASSSTNTKTPLYNHPIHLSGWVARKSVRLYVDKKYRCHYLAMLGCDPPQSMSLASISGRRVDNEGEEFMLVADEEEGNKDKKMEEVMGEKDEEGNEKEEEEEEEEFAEEYVKREESKEQQEMCEQQEGAVEAVTANQDGKT